MKKYFSWILAIASCLLIAVLIIVGILWAISSAGNEGGVGVATLPLILLFVFALSSGITARCLAGKGGIAGKIAFPFCLFYLLIYCAYVIYWLINEIKKNGISQSNNNEESKILYVVNDDGYNRTLKLFDKFCQDYGAPLGPNYGAYYSRFRDDIGQFWRSYDGNKTFIKETVLKERGWNIS